MRWESACGERRCRRAEKAVGRSGEVVGNGKVNRRLLLVLLLLVVSLYG